MPGIESLLPAAMRFNRPRPWFLIALLCSCLGAVLAPSIHAQTLPLVAADAAESEVQIEQFIERWRKAWEARDADLYLAHYAPSYAGKAETPAAWQASRRQVLHAASDLEIRFEAPEIYFSSPVQAEVHFRQHYRSASHADIGKKVLTLVRWDGRWLITAEQFTPLQ